jgi:hypothetical protein
MKKIESFIGHNWKWILAVVLLIGVTLYLSHCSIKRQESRGLETVDDFEKQSLDSSVVKYWTDMYNKEHSIVKSEQAVNSTQSAYLDSIANLLKIARKQIKAIEVMRSETVIDAEPISTNSYFDTLAQEHRQQLLRSIVFNWKDKWTSIEGKVMVSGKGNEIQIKTIDSITSVEYWKRNKILGLAIGRQQGYVDYSSTNPHNTITGGKRLELTPPKQQYSLNLSINAGYNPFMPNLNLRQPQFTIGLSIGKTLIKF